MASHSVPVRHVFSVSLFFERGNSCLDCSNIDSEAIETEVAKYHRTANQVTKALPNNPVAPKLLAMVEEFKEVVPVLVDLCNPNLRAKASHMTEVDALLGVHLEAEDLTLGKLVETDVISSCVTI